MSTLFLGLTWIGENDRPGRKAGLERHTPTEHESREGAYKIQFQIFGSVHFSHLEHDRT
jgi:hypothetical protein